MCVLDGIIPARAGFTAHFGSSRLVFPDHPRSRGVYPGRSWCAPTNLGSSPLARGLPTPRLREHPISRIIPARAGFTRPRTGERAGEWDHPRSRGVYGFIVRFLSVVVGSSPLARGLLSGPLPFTRPRRIIPARAGFTGKHFRARAGYADHPRSRGVYMQYLPHVILVSGSSPLARGLRSPTR